MNIKKIGVILLLLFFSTSYLWNITNAFNLKELKAKLELRNKTKEHKIIKGEDQQKKEEKSDYLKLKNIEIDSKFYNIYKSNVDKKLQLYNQYLAEQNRAKKKAMEAKYSYLKILKKQVKEIKKIIKNNDFLYMWSLYLPINSNLIFFKYNEKLYFTPSFDSKIESKINGLNLSKYSDKKYENLKKIYNTNKINNIKNETEFNQLNKEFWLIDFDTVKQNINIFSDSNINIEMYPTIAVKEALKEKNIAYNSKWLFTFFLLNDYGDSMVYKSHYFRSSLKLVSDYFMNVWQNNIWINWYINSLWYKEIFLPLRVTKQQKITIIKEKNPSIFDIVFFLWILLIGGGLIYLGLRKMFNIYNDLE